MITRRSSHLQTASCQHWATGQLRLLAIGIGIGATVRSLSSGGITDRSANPTHLGAEDTSVFGMGARVPCNAVAVTTCSNI